jgi:uncharacterized protein (DUF1501 family)
MNRRDFLQYAALATSGGLMLPFANDTDLSKTGKIVVLVHLKGGNDGFNTLVPYADDEYYKLRPNIGIKERTLIKLKDGYGMHPRLKQLEPLWKKGQMAWVQGIGYPHSVLSHFQSLDIWESASFNNFNNGWLSQVVPRMKQGLHGIVIDDGVEGGGVMLGSNLNAVTMKNPITFIKAANRIEDIEINRRNHAIAHVTSIQHQLHAVGKQIAEKVGTNPRAVPGKYSGKLGHDLGAVAQMILSGVDAPVYKVTQEGFDTHAGQITAQSNALFQLANGINDFANAMNQRGMWKKVIVITYSEFGRRAKENKGFGTDHGTASAHMVFGGNIRGGIWGKAPDLSKLDANGNVLHTADFRALYGTIAQNWWRQSNPWKGYGTLPFLG